MSEEKPPESAESYYTTSIRNLLDKITGRRADKLKAKTAASEKVDEWRSAVDRATRVRQFLQGDFWKHDLHPFLTGEAALKPWRPGEAKTLEEVTVSHLWSSGKAVLLDTMVKQFEKWIRAGDDAEVAMQRDAEHRAAERIAREKRASGGVTP